jgi:hypothetical protein
MRKNIWISKEDLPIVKAECERRGSKENPKGVGRVLVELIKEEEKRKK